MQDADAFSKIQNLVVYYYNILRRNGLSWITKDSQKVAVYHILSADVLQVYSYDCSQTSSFYSTTSARTFMASSSTPYVCSEHSNSSITTN